MVAFEAVLRDPERIEYAILSDVSASILGEYELTSFNDDPDLLYADIAIHNDGTYFIDAPLLVGVINLDEPTIEVVGHDGATGNTLLFIVADSGDAILGTTVFITNLGAEPPKQNIEVISSNPAAPIANLTGTINDVAEGDVINFDVEADDPDGEQFAHRGEALCPSLCGERIPYSVQCERPNRNDAPTRSNARKRPL